MRLGTVLQFFITIICRPCLYLVIFLLSASSNGLLNFVKRTKKVEALSRDGVQKIRRFKKKKKEHAESVPP